MDFYRGSYGGYMGFTKISFANDPHCELLEEKLKRMKFAFMFKSISSHIEHDLAGLLFEITVKLGSGGHYYFSKKFARSLRKIGEEPYISAEREFVVNNAPYSKFKNSPFYQDLKREISALFSGQYTRWNGHQVSIFVEEIGRMVIQQPSTDSREKFYMNFETYDYFWLCDRGDVYELLSTLEYRSLDHIESSMLAIALTEDFPERFKLRFKCYLENRGIAFILYPQFVPFPATPNVTSSGPRDLY